MTGCIAQEDYWTRRRQLKSGAADAVDRPAVAPWDAGPEAPAAGWEDAVTGWAAGGWPRPEVVADDEHITGEALEFEVAASEVRALRASGDRVAFALRQRGTYRGGLGGAPGPDFLDANGIVRVDGGRVISGRVIRDRMGLHRRRAAA